MRYVIRNIKNYIRTEGLIFTLMVVCVIASTIVMFFSFGLYHHMLQKRMDAQLGQNEITINLIDSSYTIATKKNVIKACMTLPEEVLSHCYFCATARLPGEENFSDAEVGMAADMSLYYSVYNGKITTADIGEEFKRQKYIIDGDWFTAEQIEQGELVCLAAGSNAIIGYKSDAADQYLAQYRPDENGNYHVGGKTYRCIGHLDWGTVPLVPVTTLEDDIYVYNVIIYFDKVVNRKAYDAIVKSFDVQFGNVAHVLPLAAPNLDGTKFYTTLVVICMLMAVLSGVVLAMLYEYILLQRKRQLTIFRMCGLTLTKVKEMYLLECMLITIFSLAIAMVLFRCGILPWAERRYEYIGESYTWASGIVLCVIYVTGTMAVLLGMLQITLRKNIYDIYVE